MFFHKPPVKVLSDKERFMESKEMVARILLGQHNIDKMRAEISQLVTMLVGMVARHCTPPDTWVNGLAKNDTHYWVVTGSVAKNRKSLIKVKLMEKRPGSEGVYYPIYTRSPDADTLESIHVQKVHENLPMLLEAMLQHHKKPLMDSLKYLLDASDAILLGE